MLQLMRLATYCRDTWVRRPWTPARIRPSQGDRFLMDSYPCPPPRGRAAALAVRHETLRGAILECPARGPATQPPTRSGQWHPGRAGHGARGPLVPPVQKLGVEHQPQLPR